LEGRKKKPREKAGDTASHAWISRKLTLSAFSSPGLTIHFGAATTTRKKKLWEHVCMHNLLIQIQTVLYCCCCCLQKRNNLKRGTLARWLSSRRVSSQLRGS
jgi:hypothetical protein